jgi:SNF family Na+-dependent transporter
MKVMIESPSTVIIMLVSTADTKPLQICMLKQFRELVSTVFYPVENFMPILSLKFSIEKKVEKHCLIKTKNSRVAKFWKFILRVAIQKSLRTPDLT